MVDNNLWLHKADKFWNWDCLLWPSALSHWPNLTNNLWKSFTSFVVITNTHCTNSMFVYTDKMCVICVCVVSQGQLYLLVTDQGFLTEEKVVWESLHNVDGDGNFCDSEFRLRPPSDPETVYRGQQDQIDQVWALMQARLAEPVTIPVQTVMCLNVLCFSHHQCDTK